MRIHYYNFQLLTVGATCIAANFGKPRGNSRIGGVCRAVPASYGFGLTLQLNFKLMKDPNYIVYFILGIFFLLVMRLKPHLPTDGEIPVTVTFPN